MVHIEVVGLKNGELVMGGILEGDCKHKTKTLQFTCNVAIKLGLAGT